MGAVFSCERAAGAELDASDTQIEEHKVPSKGNDIGTGQRLLGCHSPWCWSDRTTSNLSQKFIIVRETRLKTVTMRLTGRDTGWTGDTSDQADNSSVLAAGMGE